MASIFKIFGTDGMRRFFGVFGCCAIYNFFDIQHRTKIWKNSEHFWLICRK